MTPQAPGYRYYSLISSLFVAVLLISNTVGVKIIAVGGLEISGGIVVFPISYIFGDILTEVYGYKAARRIIWTGLGCAVLMSTTYYLVEFLPAAPFWQDQQAYAVILGFVPHLTLASIVAYFCGEFMNSYVLARMKVLTGGRYLWTRTIGSTIVGEGIDTVIFNLIAFAGRLTPGEIVWIAGSSYVVKVLYEIVATPLTYWVVNHLKRAEGVDVFDMHTRFNPFILEPLETPAPQPVAS